MKYLVKYLKYVAWLLMLVLMWKGSAYWATEFTRMLDATNRNMQAANQEEEMPSCYGQLFLSPLELGS
jgi:hypothetical protein